VSETETGAFPTRKIALLGSAPSSLPLAPFHDPSWEIWGCSPGVCPHAKRLDAWFEIHPLSQPEITTDYIQWMANLTVPVWMIEPDSRVPRSIKYPREHMVAEFGKFFFTSSLSWMLALAIMQKPAEIGLWGVDMSASDEYVLQRPGCHFFITEAIKRGIKVYIPPQSDLAEPPYQYGFIMNSPMYKKMVVRRNEIAEKQARALSDYEEARNRFNFFSGALDDIDYMLRTWVE
jgi:hypothetical protein